MSMCGFRKSQVGAQTKCLSLVARSDLSQTSKLVLPLAHKGPQILPEKQWAAPRLATTHWLEMTARKNGEHQKRLYPFGFPFKPPRTGTLREKINKLANPSNAASGAEMVVGRAGAAVQDVDALQNPWHRSCHIEATRRLFGVGLKVNQREKAAVGGYRSRRISSLFSQDP